MTSPKCQMIKPHHPDCTCPWCKASLDEECSAPAVATLFDGKLAAGRMCEECAIATHVELTMHLDVDIYQVWRVQRDDGRPVVAS